MTLSFWVAGSEESVQNDLASGCEDVSHTQRWATNSHVGIKIAQGDLAVDLQHSYSPHY